MSLCLRVPGALLIVVIVAGCSLWSSLGGPPPATAAPACLRGEYRLVPTDGQQVTADDLATTRAILENRLGGIGVTGAVVETQGADRIVVELPCVPDEEEVRRVIGSTGRIDFVPIPRGTPGIGMGTVLGTSLAACPSDLATISEPCVLFSGDQIDSVTPGFTSTGQKAVDFTLRSDGAALFDQLATSVFAGVNSPGNGQFAIVVDGTVVSAPMVNASHFGGRGQISGAFTTAAEVMDLVTVLRYGTLPVAIEEISFSVIGPSPSP